jgi:hypothetical protein
MSALADPVADERDVEDEQAKRGEPEGALRERLAGERAADDPRQRVPTEAGRNQRSPADDHDVRVREVADQVAGVSGAGEPLGRPRQVLGEHVEAAENKEAGARDEVLRELLVVRPELAVRIGLRADRRRLAGDEPPDRGEHDGDKRKVRQELERGEVLQVHGASISADPAR